MTKIKRQLPRFRPEESNALGAFAQMIEQHCIHWCEAIILGIKVDVWEGRTSSLTEGVAELNLQEEWQCVAGDFAPWPEGALPWIERMWCAAFQEQIHLAAAKVSRDQGMKMLKELLQSHGIGATVSVFESVEAADRIERTDKFVN